MNFMDVFFLAGFFEKKLFGGFFGMLVEVGKCLGCENLLRVGELVQIV